MSDPWKFAPFILAVMLLQTHSKPLESTDEGLTEMEKDLASLSVLRDGKKRDTDEDEITESLLKDLQGSQDDVHQTGLSKSDEDSEDEDKIPVSLLTYLKSRDETSHATKRLDKAALQGFAPGPPGTDEDVKKTIDTKALQGFAPGTNDEPKRTTQTESVLLSEDDINDKQQRLFDILSQDHGEDKDKIPEDLLKDLLKPKNREDQPKKPESTWLEPTDKNDEVKKRIMTAILLDEIVNEVQEKNKRGERIPDRVLNLLRKYNAKRSGSKL